MSLYNNDRETEQHLQNILNSVQLFVWSFDISRNIYTYCSSGVVCVLGVTAEELQANSSLWNSVIHPEDRHIPVEVFGHLGENQSFDMEYRILRRDGEVRWIQVVGTYRTSHQCDGVVVDITDKKSSQIRLHEQQDRNQRLINFLPDAVVMHRDGVVFYANESAVNMMRLKDVDAALGQKIWTFLDPERSTSIRARFMRLNTQPVGAKLLPIEQTLMRADGTVFEGEIRSVLIEDDHQPAVLTIIKDISTQKRLQGELEHMAYHDALTGLPNRRHLSEHLDKVLHRGFHLNTSRHAVLFLDLDHFKNTNDLYGHAFGDAVLRAVANRLKSVVDADSLLARIGGDEFAILIPDCTNQRDPIKQAKRILDAIRTTIMVSGRECVFTPSVGIAMYPEGGHDVDTLLKHADLAMYTAKRNGGNRVSMYQPEDGQMIEERVRVETGIRKALENNELFVVYQPKILTADEHIGSAEALVRWRTPDGTVLTPDKFIPIAEETGLIAELGERVLREACLQNRAWMDKGYTPIVISVNVSPKQFQLQNMYEVIRRVVTETGLQPEWLAIEITEGLLVQNSSEIARILKQIRDFGVKIAIDDFGTGYSSLGYLRLFDPTHLKIDQSFVSRMLTNDGDMCIVSAVIHLAHNLGMHVVAEGVETAEQYARLKAEGCDMVQGYLVSKPVLPAEIEMGWLQVNRLTV